MSEPADSQPMLVALSPIDHCIDSLGEDFPCLHYNRPIMLPQLLVDGKRALNCGRGH